MSNVTDSRFRNLFGVIVFLAVSLISMRVSATNHIITFNVGLVYNPSQLNVLVGDTVTFDGNFIFHPLQFVSVPDGAVMPPVIEDGEFWYVVQVPGTYNYVCQSHQNQGMVGSFTAATSSVKEDEVVAMSVWPNPVSTLLKIELPEDAGEVMTVSLYDTKSQSITVNAAPYLSAGRLEIGLAHLGLVPGMYMVAVETDKRIYRRKIVIE